MPAADKAYLKQRTIDSGVQLISSEAPLEKFGPVRGPNATYFMQVKQGANLNNMAQPYRPMSKDKYKALVVTIHGRELMSDGTPFHLSWSVDGGFSSGAIGPAIARDGFKRLAEPFVVDLSAGPAIRSLLRRQFV